MGVLLGIVVPIAPYRSPALKGGRCYIRNHVDSPHNVRIMERCRSVAREAGRATGSMPFLPIRKLSWCFVTAKNSGRRLLSSFAPRKSRTFRGAKGDDDRPEIQGVTGHLC